MTDSFNIFWKAYPRKVGKKPAELKYAKAVKKAGFATIMAGLERWKAAWIGTEPQFIPHASTWLNQERYNDTPDLKGNGGQPEGVLARSLDRVTGYTDALAAVQLQASGSPLSDREQKALQEWAGPRLTAYAARLGLTLPPVTPYSG